MKIKALTDITGDTVREWYEWLKKENCGCCSIEYNTDWNHGYYVCMGWHDTGEGWQIAWKIGWQTYNNAMQTDFDIDFEMPYNEDGDIDDTLDYVHENSDWDMVAEDMRKAANRVWNEWRDEDEY